MKIGSALFDPIMASPKSFLKAVYAFYIIKWNLNQSHKCHVPKAHKSCHNQIFITTSISNRKFEAQINLSTLVNIHSYTYLHFSYFIKYLFMDLDVNPLKN